MVRQPTPARSEAPIDEVETLLGDWLETPPDRRAAALDELVRAHPDSADELLERVAVLESLLGELPTEESPLPERLGPFVLGKRLGGGGMGVVYAAKDEDLGREVALKVVRPDLVFFGKARARFRREVEAIARLQHPGIVPVYSVGEEDGLPWFAMERVGGKTLAEVVDALSGRAPEALNGSDLANVLGAEEPPEPWRGSWVDACLDVARQVAGALHHAHERGVVHRDVKPSNVLLTADGRARLIDFGLTAAEGTDSLTRSGATLGTLLYMAPEQIRGGRDADARADVYGLGATLYELLALQTHVGVDGPLEVQRRILAGELEPLRSRNRAVGVDVDTVVGKALDLERSRRYGTAAALELDLANLLARRPVAARPLGALLRARRWTQRRPALAVTIALGALLLFGVPTALFLQERVHARELARSLDDARTAHAQAEEVVQFLLGAFEAVNPETNGGQRPTVKAVLDEAAATLDVELADRPVDRARLYFGMAKVYHDLGEHTAAEPLLDDVITELEGVDGDWVAPLRATALALRSAVLVVLDRTEEAERDALAAIDWAAATGDELVPANVGGYHGALADVRFAQGDYGESLDLRRLAIDELERREAGPEHAAKQRILIATALARMGRADEARMEAEAALETLEAGGAPGPNDLAAAHNILGLAHKLLGDAAPAEAAYRKARAILLEHYGPDVPGTRTTESNLIGLLELAGRYEEAGRQYLELAEWFADYFGPKHSTALLLRGNGIGNLFNAKRFDEVIPMLEELIPLRREVNGEEHPLVAAAHGQLGEALAYTGRPAESREHLERSAELFDRLEQPKWSIPRYLAASTQAMAAGDEDAARELARRALDAIEAHGIDHPQEAAVRAFVDG